MDLDIIIPTKGNVTLLRECLESIIKHTTKTTYRVIVADTGSTPQEFKQITATLKDLFSETNNAKLAKYNYYNFSKINNAVVKAYADSDMLLFCNNDIQLTSNCIDPMIAWAKQKDIGTVGCKLLFPDNTIQHAGQMAWTQRPHLWPYDTDKLEVSHRGLRQPDVGFDDSEPVVGNTAAFMMVKKELFDEVGGFPEQYMECFEDVHFNMLVKLRGYTNMYVGEAVALHHESVTRTKSREAIWKLEHDYLQNLYPYWNSLTPDEHVGILSL